MNDQSAEQPEKTIQFPDMTGKPPGIYKWQGEDGAIHIGRYDGPKKEEALPPSPDSAKVEA